MEVYMETKLTLKLNGKIINLAHDNNTPKKYPPLIEKLSRIISEKDLKKISKEDERVRYILRKL